MVEASGQGGRAERTRTAVLEAAETLFAERGFDATRLEDIAERVGIRRASIVYYYKDKRELYEAVLGSVLGDLHQAVADVLSRDAPLVDRIESAVSTWVDYVGARPTLARLTLREVANAAGEPRAAIVQHLQPFFDLVAKEVFGRPDFDPTTFAKVDPAQVATSVAGSTLFFVAAMPALVPQLGLDPTSREQLEAHKEEVIGLVRRLLGEAVE